MGGTAPENSTLMPAAPPPDRSDRLQALIAQPFAHRGLHGPGRIENSRAAFLAAIDRGHGIELDVQVSRDGAAMVFHDRALDHLTGEQGQVAALDASALQRIGLKGSGEAIPTLAEVLALIAGRVPLLIEVKAQRQFSRPLCRSVAAALDGYRGPVAIMSFNPRVPRWFAGHRPLLLRGLVVTEENRGGRRGALARRLASHWARPDFLAYDVRDLPSAFAARARRRELPVLTWTVRTPDQRAAAASHADQIIYEDRP